MRIVFLAWMYSLLFIPGLLAFNLRKVTLENGSSVIRSVFQDERGLIWIASNSGLSTYDGKELISFNGYKGVKNLYGTSKGDLFAETLYGLNVIHTGANMVATFEAFNNISFSAVDRKGSCFLIQGNGFVYYKSHTQENYDNIIVADLVEAKVKAFFVDDNDVMRILTEDGLLRSFNISYTNGLVSFEEKRPLQLSSNITFSFAGERSFFFVDEEYALYKLDLASDDYAYLMDLKPLLADKGKITSGIIFKNEFYFGTESALFRIKNNKAVKIPVKAGVSCLVKDRYQDLIWISTMGDGLYTYSFDPHTIKSYLFSDFHPAVSRPATAICLDKHGTLWIGTEGAGIVLLPDFNPDKEITTPKTLVKENGLPDDNVYSFHESAHGVWIGCKSGLAFYSYKHKRISMLRDVSLGDIRAIYEDGPVLWLACYEKGMVKARVIYEDEIPRIEHTRCYSIGNQDEASNRFSSIYANGKTLLFANTGNGVYRFLDDKLDRVGLAGDRFKSVNQIVSINESDYIATTDFGCFRFTLNNNMICNEYAITDAATKDILLSGSSSYWLSADNGLFLYNKKRNSIQCFNSSCGLRVTEYCNGSSFKDKQNGVLFFGGINGFTTIQNNYYDEAMDYMPTLFVEKISLFGIQENIDNFKIDKSNKLVFRSEENVFSITFNVLDYINGNNCVFYYKIADGQWIDNGNSGTVSFTDISPGTYDLYMKYYNKRLSKESYIQKLSIRVLPPWYHSISAYMTYAVLGLLFVFLSAYFLLKRRRKMKEEELARAEQRRKEEIYEAKLNFFTDIAHEFCTPLTLISGPCSLILNQKNIGASVQKYADIIGRNAKRMNLLINDLMAFKRMESGYKIPEISRLNVSSIADRIVEAFKINTSGNSIKIEKQYGPEIAWNSDEEFLNTILVNLISNAVKYSNDESALVEIRIDNDTLILKVTNRGKGIAKEDMGTVFNRFSISASDKQKGWNQNGLGLTVAGSMVKLLSGHIDVISIPDEYTTFIVNLPSLEAKGNTLCHKSEGYELDVSIVSDCSIPQTKYIYKDDRLTVTIIDNDPEMLWLICDTLSDEFNVLPIHDASAVTDILSQKHTDIILSDLMMGDIDGIELAKILKSDKSTSHIPLIIVSAIHDIERQTEALNAGAEIYITKPFDPKHLKTTIKRLLGRKEDLKEYFRSPLSAYELDMGKLRHAEHRKFLKQVYGVISRHIQDENLSPNFIAAALGMSLRTLYRKLKEVTDKGLLEIIREGKLIAAENLLLKSKFTIDEIVFKSGFSSRASFYRAFTHKYGCTPTEFIARNTILP